MNPSAPSISTASLDPALARLVDDITSKLQRGERVNLSAALEAHPEFADELRGLLPALAALGDLSQSNEVEGLGLPTAIDGTLGDFRLIREVGRGGMGVVYEALQISLNRRVALKVLPFAATMDPRQLQRFKTEAQAAAYLHHTNIVPVHFVGSERGVHFYAMQFIVGRTLADAIRELRLRAGLTSVSDPNETVSPSEALAKPSPTGAASTLNAVAGVSTERSVMTQAHFRTVAEWGIQAAEALDYAHQQGIVHRDIKPANVLIDNSAHLWITDFGLAHCQSGGSLTMTGDLVGTLRYMSPEQALAQRMTIDHRTDVYSLGATLYELLTLRPVIEGRDRAEILKQLTFDEPKTLRYWICSVPPELETIVLKSLEKHPDGRYQTARDLADDLRRYLLHEPIRAKRPGMRERVVKWARRHKYLVRSAAAVMGVAVVALGLSTSLLWKKDRETEAARQRAESNLQNALAALDRVYLQVVEKRYPVQVKLDQADRALLQDVLGYYEQFARDNESQVEVRFELAKAHLRAGELKKKLGHDNWRDSVGRALNLLKNLVDASPDNPDYQHALATCCLVNYRHLEGARIWDKLADQFPTNFEYRRGQVYSRTRYNSDWTLLESSMPVAERLVRDFPTQSVARLHLAECHNRHGTFAWHGRRLAESEKHYRAAQAILEALVMESSEDFDSAEMLGHNCMDLGEVLIAVKKMREAENTLRQGLAIQQKLIARYPGAPAVQLELGRTWGKLADLFMAEKRTEEERSAVAEATRALESLPTIDLYDKGPGLAGRWFDILAVSQRRLGNQPEARRLSEMSLQALRRAILLDPNDQGARHRIVAACQHKGDAWRDENQFEEAEQCYRDAVNEADLHLRALTATQTPVTDEDVQANPVASRFHLSQFMRSIGKARAADIVDQETVSRYDSIVVQYPKNWILAQCLLQTLQSTSADNLIERCRVDVAIDQLTNWAGDEPVRLNNLAWILVASPRLSLRSAQHALTLARDAERRVPNGATLNTLGVAHLRCGNWVEAVDSLTKSTELDKVQTGINCFCLAIAHCRLGHAEKAAALFSEGVNWMVQHDPNNPELKQFRKEAADLLNIQDEPKTDDPNGAKPANKKKND